MLPQDLLYPIALKQIPGIGDVLIKNLISYCGSAEAVFKEKRGKLSKIPGIGEVLAQNIVSHIDFARAEKELLFIEKNKITCYYYLENNYPQRLREILDAPILMYGLGNFGLNPPRMVGIVGTRNASEYGRQFTQKLVQELKEHQVQIISGLAVGIDGIAHKAATDIELTNIGVLAHGLDRLYPSDNKALAKRMLSHGGLLTEFPSKTNPDRENFPKRNRIVAGLADVLILVETAIKGGARITAEIANSYNKDVMALPGRTTDYYSQGCNYLIKESKAAMITCTDDLLELMNWKKSKKARSEPNLFSVLAEEDKLLVEYIRKKVKVGLDEMAFDLNVDPGSLALKLLELEFAKHIRTLPGKTYELS
ncbi:MAG: DNA-processing protein DprA [Bacteroidia bacterium]|nr:DNA-processing protein DprA [Bacteroidia bacterium]MCF8446641.1 DNA-processing protein DprA [Bacteroidia bacterium]